ncbi:ABC transporter permease family protein [Pseudothauera rhizosphaerae]|uniref:ABC transporter permease n=1 Tax=Pseudothauera rhizosphaerae TaxID=2565932 RepID=A0A4S4AJX1_9RHOO|nr:ABC transporter permease [Pseudothauera rhizosphaerae]THF58623.1 ABC transporter permease [Pseudothauera rhizosphaerae]
MDFLLREAWHEFRAGLRNGIVPLVYLVLTGYILLVMTSADSLRSMGAVDIPRNAPALVYLMTAGDAFFLFFAWAWVFAQPIVRDRGVRLQEIVLAAPVSLRALLAARYVGALGVALVLGTSQIAGFLCAPLLEAAGALPPGSVAPLPWFAFGWAFLIFTLPLAAGAGALYFVAAMKTRGVGGPFAVAAALMAFWMVSMIVLKEGHADPFLVTVLDPSGFAEVEHRVVDHWTPHEKSTALLPLVPALAWNRVIWGLLPLLLLAFTVARASREALVLGRAERAAAPRRNARAPAAERAALPGPVVRATWLRAALAEAVWQVRYVLARRWLWPTLGLLVVLAVAAGFVHGVQHAWGPMVARPEFISPVLSRTFYLIIVFMVAALVGLIARRDEQPGLVEMFDAAPAPDGVRLAGRAAAALAASTACVMVPALGAALVGLLTGGSTSVVLPLAYQLTVLLPPILELAAITLLLHALIRHAGTAHAAAVLAAFIAVVNFETEVINYPPHQIGIGVPIALSGLTGFAPWCEKLLASDGFKLAVAGLLLAVTALATRRGTDLGWRPRLRHLRASAFGLAGIGAVAGVVAIGGLSAWLHQRYVVEGGYETDEETLAKDAAWEKRWLPRQGAFSVAGGEVALTVRPAARELRGDWRLDGVRAAGGELHALLPIGFELVAARVAGQPAAATAEDDHLSIPLSACAGDAGCTVEIAWRLPAAGWDAGRRPSWLVGDAWWLRAQDVMPRLGLDAGRVPRVPADRERHGLPAGFVLPAYAASLPADAVAPAGRWRWRVGIEGESEVHGGEIDGLLDFAALHAPEDARRTEANGVVLIHDAGRGADAAVIADDLAAMRACVARHLDGVPAVAAVAQWPRGLPPGTEDAALAANVLLLAEAPHWDVAGEGTGRQVRRVDIAAALARRAVLDAADLRQGSGALWLSAGLPGALGLLCVAEADGAAALQALLGRGAVRVTQDLAAAEVPVGPLSTALADGWAAQYAPLAALAWSARQTPASFAALLAAVRAGQDVAGPLGEAAGTDQAALFLGPPHAVDLHRRDGAVSGERWQWRNGGWEGVDAAPVPWSVPAAAPHSLLLDDWPAYEREPADNAERP